MCNELAFFALLVFGLLAIGMVVPLVAALACAILDDREARP